MRKKLLFVAAVSLLFIGGCSSQEASTSTSSKEKKSNTALAQPEQIYQKNCSSCHGDNLQGDRGPNLQKIGGKLDKAQILNQIQNGGERMPPQSQLSPEEQELIATWLSEKK